LEEVEMMKEELKKMKKGFSKTVDLVEKVANLPSEEPIKAPAKLSKKEEQFANIIKIAQQLKNK
jgi:Asp-tRNA(Asn)/Glu-tRNA(Gln) amidotransferase C subunit